MSETYLGIPRKEIPWFPTIDQRKCTGCLTCAKDCPHGVFQIQGDPPRPTVANPYDCLVTCEACAKECPNGAITFPTRGELKYILRKLREKYPLEM